MINHMFSLGGPGGSRTPDVSCVPDLQSGVIAN